MSSMIYFIFTLLIRLLSSIYESTIIGRSPVLTCETYTYYALILRNYKGSLVVEKFPYHYVLEGKVSYISIRKLENII